MQHTDSKSLSIFVDHHAMKTDLIDHNFAPNSTALKRRKEKENYSSDQNESTPLYIYVILFFATEIF